MAKCPMYSLTTLILKLSSLSAIAARKVPVGAPAMIVNGNGSVVSRAIEQHDSTTAHL